VLSKYLNNFDKETKTNGQRSPNSPSQKATNTGAEIPFLKIARTGFTNARTTGKIISQQV